MKSRCWTYEINEWGEEDPASLSPQLASAACWRLRVWNPDVEADLHLYYWAVPDSLTFRQL
jgi:hypothetical protein